MELETRRKIQVIKDEAEIKKWSNIKRRPRPRFYLVYALIIICLAYVVDELATNINGLVQTDVIESFFNNNTSQYTIVTTLCSGISIFSFFFRALADKYGRKPFLFINVFGMALGMLCCFIAPNVIFYIVGMTISFFFTPCDVQVLYVIETSSDKRRALNLSITKAIGILGIAIIPLFSKWIHINGWQSAFFIPMLIGLVVGLLAMFFIKESEVFIDCKISMLEDRIRVNKSKKKKFKEEKKGDNGGIIPAIKHIFKNHIFLWLFLAMFVFAISTIGTSNFDLILTLAQNKGLIDDTSIANAKIVYPFACALIIIFNGLISDLSGRRKSAIFDVVISLISIILFVISLNLKWNYHITGLTLGCFIGGYLAGLDTMTIICSEESPTNLRSSIMSVLSIAISGGTLLATGLLLLFNKFYEVFKQFDFGICVAIIVPFAINIALFILLSKIPETRGQSLSINDNSEEDVNSKTLKTKNK